MQKAVVEEMKSLKHGILFKDYEVTNFAATRVIRIMQGETGMYTDYRHRLDTRSESGDTN